MDGPSPTLRVSPVRSGAGGRSATSGSPVRPDTYPGTGRCYRSTSSRKACGLPHRGPASAPNLRRPDCVLIY